MPLIKTFPVIGLAVVLVAFSAYADEFAPLPMTNQSPLVQIHGLPAPGTARLLPAGQLEVGLSYETANYFFSGTTPSESLLLDGETHRTALTVRHGTGEAEWGIEIPHLSHSGGFMDGFIESWHDTFGMRNGGRDAVQRDQLAYIYQRNGSELLRLTRTTRGTGDVRLYAARSLQRDTDNIDIALRTSVKLPTGESSELLGSGAYDVALWLTASCSRAACPGTVRWNAAGGLLWLGQGDVLPDLQRRRVSFGSVGIGWRAWQSIVLKTDLRLHSRFYDGSELEPLNASTAQLLLGTVWNISARTALEVGLSEDLKVYSAPDVSLSINLRAVF